LEQFLARALGIPAPERSPTNTAIDLSSSFTDDKCKVEAVSDRESEARRRKLLCIDGSPLGSKRARVEMEDDSQITLAFGVSPERPKDQEPTAELPKDEEPTAEHPKEEEPTAELPKEGKPTAEFPNEEKPTAEHPEDEKPTAEHFKEEKPTAEHPKDEQPAAEHPKDEKKLFAEDKGKDEKLFAEDKGKEDKHSLSDGSTEAQEGMPKDGVSAPSDCPETQPDSEDSYSELPYSPFCYRKKPKERALAPYTVPANVLPVEDSDIEEGAEAKDEAEAKEGAEMPVAEEIEEEAAKEIEAEAEFDGSKGYRLTIYALTGAVGVRTRGKTGQQLFQIKVSPDIDDNQKLAAYVVEKLTSGEYSQADAREWARILKLQGLQGPLARGVFDEVDVAAHSD